MKAYTDPKARPKDQSEVYHRIEYLRELNRPLIGERAMIRKLMNGGQGAVDVLLSGLRTNEQSLPAANHIKSGIERFSEMIAPVPDLRIEPPEHTDSDRPRKAAEKRQRIVANYDRLCDLPGQLEQASLWLPGYGFFAWRLVHARDRNGHPYPKAELRDPYSTWPAEWGPDHEPRDIAFSRTVPTDDLKRIYPNARPKQSKRPRSMQYSQESGLHTTADAGGWDGSRGGIEVIEYLDDWGVYVYSPYFDGLLDSYPHPLNRGPFRVVRRVTFDQLKGHFTDVVGLASVMARLTLLTQIVMEDAAFAPMVVTGEMDAPFRKGRDAVNFVRGGGAQYVTQNLPYQMFSEIERIEKHLRSSSGYSQQADGESPMSFVTGAGLEELGSSITRQVERYQRVLSKGLVALDAMRLEYDEVAFGKVVKALDDTVKGGRGVETYEPGKHIDGHYGTRRVYGLMASWDEPRKLVGGLQLLSAGVIDQTTLRENLSGLDNIPRIEERQRKDQAQAVLFMQMQAAAEAQDPRALQAMLQVHKTGKLDEAIEEFFAPPEEDPAEEAMAGLPEQPPGLDQVLGMLGAGGGPGGRGDGQVLSRLTAAGETQGGSQTVNPLGGA
ncbi:MAG: hypothetical protein ACOC02_01405 [Guyparkeria sp.]